MVPAHLSQEQLIHELALGSITALGRASPAHPLPAPSQGNRGDGEAAHPSTPECSSLEQRWKAKLKVYKLKLCLLMQ